MKNTLLFILTLSVNLVFAQEINQFDSNGNRHGIWRKNFDGTNAVRYEGQFKHGKEIGLFKFYKYIDQKSVLSASKEFNTENNVASVTFYSSNGKIISKGKMKGKKYIGKWEYFHKNSDQLLRVENYDDNGLQQGELLVFYKNGKLAEKSNYVNGKLNGKSIWYNETGVMIKELNYNNDGLHGLAKHYNYTGVLILEGHYKNDKKHGVWKYYDKGKLIKEKDFTRRSKNPYKE